MDEAIDGGVIDESDTTAEGLRSLHEEYGRQAIETLRERDRLADARRRGVDPRTGKQPRTPAARDRLTKTLADGPERQDHAFDVLILTYRDAFGDAAAEAFAKALRARHAGVEIVTDSMGITAAIKPLKLSSPRQRLSTVLPVPKPLPAAIAAGHFGYENGVAIRPSSAEVRAITERHAERMIEILHEVSASSGNAEVEALQTKYDAARASYAESFGESAAARLHVYVRHEAAKQIGRPRNR